MLGKSSENIPPNGGLMVIYHGSEEQKHLKQIQKYKNTTKHIQNHTHTNTFKPTNLKVLNISTSFPTS